MDLRLVVGRNVAIFGGPDLAGDLDCVRGWCNSSWGEVRAARVREVDGLDLLHSVRRDLIGQGDREEFEIAVDERKFKPRGTRNDRAQELQGDSKKVSGSALPSVVSLELAIL